MLIMALVCSKGLGAWGLGLEIRVLSCRLLSHYHIIELSHYHIILCALASLREHVFRKINFIRWIYHNLSGGSSLFH